MGNILARAIGTIAPLNVVESLTVWSDFEVTVHPDTLVVVPGDVDLEDAQFGHGLLTAPRLSLRTSPGAERDAAESARRCRTPKRGEADGRMTWRRIADVQPGLHLEDNQFGHALVATPVLGHPSRRVPRLLA